ncbi:MAG: Uma2 family endonuclease [Cyanobacteriota bacterium]|nr:Uma2 family endonuclease [Cyanobacteriota bacterium]
MTSTLSQPQATLRDRLPQVSLEEFLQHPRDRMEWVDGQLIEITGMTLRHSQIQLRLGSLWRAFILSNSLGGEVYTEAPCRTNKQGRRPDVAYLTPELLRQYASASALPQSFPLIAEIASPDDKGEELLAKAKEYLESGCEEVWLVFPESCWIILIARDRHQIFSLGDVIATQLSLPGFSVSVNELLAR